MQSLQEWVKALGSYDLPVLRHTAGELARLRAQEDSITARDVADVTLRDPLMTVRVLRFSQSRLTSRQPTEVTTVEHALMMHGLSSFFREFRDLKALEDVLASDPAALSGAQHVLSRAYHAALTARNFAALRHDMEGEEVTVSALLHDLAEILLWCVAPALAMQIEQMVSTHRGLRSAAAQRAALGFGLGELQVALTREWRLPRLLQDLMDDSKARHPRVLTVRASVGLARHSAHGWHDPALPDDYAALQRVTALPADQVSRWVTQSSLQAARGWHCFGVRPAAAWLPLLPGDWRPPRIERRTDVLDQALVGRVIEQLESSGRIGTDAAAVVALAFYGLQHGLGLRRLWLGIADRAGRQVVPQQSLLLEPGLAPGDLAFDLGSAHLFSKLMERMQAMWCNGQNQAKLIGLLPQALQARLGAQGFYAMSIHLAGMPYGLLFADAGAAPGGLDAAGYAAFKQLGTAFGQALARVAA